MREYRATLDLPRVVLVDTARLDRLVELDGRDDVSLSEAAGVSRRTVERIRQQGRATVTTLDKIACALGVHYTEVTL